MFTRNVRRSISRPLDNAAIVRKPKWQLPTKLFPSVVQVATTSGGYAGTVGNHGEYTPHQS